MRLLTLSALCAASLLSGCVIYENQCPYDSGWGNHGHGDHQQDDDVIDDDEDDDEDPVDDTGDAVVAPKFTLVPAEVHRGEVLIASIVADQPFDFSTIEDIEFLIEDVAKCTQQPRADELLVTIGVSEIAKLGPIDVIIRFDDGESLTLEDGLLILEAEASGDDTGAEDNGICG